jgi:hypothetical protein
MDAFEAISLPEPSASSGKRTFTVAEANRTLVLVRRIVADIVNNYRELCQLRDSYQLKSQVAGTDAAEQTRRRYIDLTDRLAELRIELDAIGCELKDFDMGLVDFPSRRHGREVCLCWKLGEQTIAYWHDTKSGYDARKPL